VDEGNMDKIQPFRLIGLAVALAFCFFGFAEAG
jgi:hypothetical protein